MAVHMLEREEHVTGTWIDADRVRSGRKEGAADDADVAARLDDGEDAALGRDIEPAPDRIECEHIGIGTDA